MKNPIDISVLVDKNLIVWPGVMRPEFKPFKSIAKGDMGNDTNLLLNAHHGTHIDAPLHFIDGGDSVDRVDLEKLIGKTYVAQIDGVKEIEASHLKKALKSLKDVKKLLFKTDNSLLWKNYPGKFYEDYCALTKEAAQFVVDSGIELVGIDYLSIQRFKDGPEVHQILLRAGVIILEGINLSSVGQGWYNLFCLPIKLKGTEAAPVRAILYPLEE